jgi:hypothetical protein
MSSTCNNTYHSSSDIDLFAAVLSNGGLFGRAASGTRQPDSTPTMLIASLLRASETSSTELPTALHRQTKRTRFRGMPPAMPRYAIQGLPISMQTTPVVEAARESLGPWSGS